MFERYTEAARRVMFIARGHAVLSGSPFIETEHLLLGLLDADPLLESIMGSEAVAAMRVQLGTAKSMIGSGPGDLPLSHECKRVLAYAAEEAERLTQRYITTAHLLLGFLREDRCRAAGILRENGVDLLRAREQIASIGPPATQEELHQLVDELPPDLWTTAAHVLRTLRSGGQVTFRREPSGQLKTGPAS